MMPPPPEGWTDDIIGELWSRTVDGCRLSVAHVLPDWPERGAYILAVVEQDGLRISQRWPCKMRAPEVHIIAVATAAAEWAMAQRREQP